MECEFNPSRAAAKFISPARSAGESQEKAKPRQGRHRRPVAPASCWLSQEPALSLSKGRPHLFRAHTNFKT